MKGQTFKMPNVRRQNFKNVTIAMSISKFQKFLMSEFQCQCQMSKFQKHNVICQNYHSY